MVDREKVIKGLECCMAEKICSSKCPYKGQCDDGGYYYSKAIEDALALLKAQEPRVMTLEEAKNADHCFCEAGNLFVCRIVPVPDGWVTIQQFGRPDMEIDSNEYGIAFRCWTSRPTDEQREAKAWKM